VTRVCLDGVCSLGDKTRTTTRTIKGEEKGDHPRSSIVLVLVVVLDSLSLLFQKRVELKKLVTRGLPRWRLLARRGQDENDDEDD
jgi:hypothetical protein